MHTYTYPHAYIHTYTYIQAYIHTYIQIIPELAFIQKEVAHHWHKCLMQEAFSTYNQQGTDFPYGGVPPEGHH